MAVDWDKTNVQELDITGTDLSTQCLIDLLTRIPALRYLSAGNQDGFTDMVCNSYKPVDYLMANPLIIIDTSCLQVLKAFMDQGNSKNLIALDLDGCSNLSEESLLKFVKINGPHLQGLSLSGIPHLTDQYWTSVLPRLSKVK